MYEIKLYEMYSDSYHYLQYPRELHAIKCILTILQPMHIKCVLVYSLLRNFKVININYLIIRV